MSAPMVTGTAERVLSVTPALTVAHVRSLRERTSDNVGVTKVEFYVDGELKGSAAARNVGTSGAFRVTVSNAPSDAIPPTASITSPAKSATVSGSIYRGQQAHKLSGRIQGPPALASLC